jgi:hypothetical protein
VVTNQTEYQESAAQHVISPTFLVHFKKNHMKLSVSRFKDFHNVPSYQFFSDLGRGWQSALGRLLIVAHFLFSRILKSGGL